MEPRQETDSTLHATGLNQRFHFAPAFLPKPSAILRRPRFRCCEERPQDLNPAAEVPLPLLVMVARFFVRPARVTECRVTDHLLIVGLELTADRQGCFRRVMIGLRPVAANSTRTSIRSWRLRGQTDSNCAARRTPFDRILRVAVATLLVKTLRISGDWILAMPVDQRRPVGR